MAKWDINTIFQRKNMKVIYHLRGLDVSEQVILKWMLNKLGVDLISFA
jgi:hypothetical protein